MQDGGLESDPSSHGKNATCVSVMLALEGRETGIMELIGYQLSSKFSKETLPKENTVERDQAGHMTFYSCLCI